MFSPDTHRVATLTEDGDVRLWDATNGEPITPSLPHLREHAIGNLAFSPDGQRLLIATGADTVFIREFTKSHASPKDLLVRAQVLSGHRIDSTAGMLALGNVALSNAWQIVHSSKAQTAAH